MVSLPSSLSVHEHGNDSLDSGPRRLGRSSPETLRRRRDPALLCVLATGTRVRGGSEHFTTAEIGCELYGVYVDADGESQESSISVAGLGGQSSTSMSCNGGPRR